MKLPDDPFIIELLPEFIDDWLSQIDERYENLITSQNADDLYRLVHTLKGSCAQFGLEELSQMGIDLMAHCKSRDWASAKALHLPIRTGFADVKNFISSM